MQPAENSPARFAPPRASPYRLAAENEFAKPLGSSWTVQWCKRLTGQQQELHELRPLRRLGRHDGLAAPSPTRPTRQGPPSKKPLCRRLLGGLGGLGGLLIELKKHTSNTPCCTPLCCTAPSLHIFPPIQTPCPTRPTRPNPRGYC